MTSSPPELTISKEFDRIYSAETDDSPFGSSLVTPTDEEIYVEQGIHERLDAAETILGYFGSKDIVSDVPKTKTIHTLQGNVREVLDVQRSESDSPNNNDGHLQDMSPSLSSDANSSQVIASIVISSSSSESIQRPITTGLYTLPNDHIVVDPEPDLNDIDAQKESSQPVDADLLSATEHDLGTVPLVDQLALANTLTCKALVHITLRVVFFLPWCVTVGGALILSPDHVEYVVFQSGYIEPLCGIRRFSHFAEYGFQHIVAFLTFLGLVTWVAPTAGFLCIGGLMAQFCWTWHSFLVDYTIPLGEDDQQTVYLLATSTWLNDTTVDLRKVGHSYYASENPTNDVYISADSIAWRDTKSD
ncbi:hypothetical protein BDN70DRAFT_345244 [Pholiota conissans]|uniref:Uncharacterized protein n=1 Tax=Pholiota conissans TaxID=109636 RepID=A0A9P5YRD0_9AGAR|nr:hypothetical protein BDN70DRAFT_345244 [Pholiota conissans]